MRISTSQVLVSLAVVAGAVGVAPVAAQAAITPAAGVQIRIGHSNKCINVRYSSTADNTPIVQYGCYDTTTNDRFRVVPVGADTYQIVATFDGTFESDPTVFTYTLSGGAAWAYVVRDSNNQVYEVLAETVGSSLARKARTPGFAEHALPKPPVD